MAEDSIRALQRRFELALALSEFELGVSPKRPEQHDELVAKRLEKLLTGRACKTTVQRTKIRMRQVGADVSDKIEPLKPGEPSAEFWARQTASKWMATYSLDPADTNHYA